MRVVLDPSNKITIRITQAEADLLMTALFEFNCAFFESKSYTDVKKFSTTMQKNIRKAIDSAKVPN